MIRLKIKEKIYTYERVIFPENQVKSDADITRYMRFYDEKKVPQNVKRDTYVTPVTDLTLPIDEIQKQYSKDVRYEIRRAARENIEFQIFDNLNANKDANFVRELAEKYYTFCDVIGQPHLKDNLDMMEFLEFVKNENLIVSKAEFENGWTYHIYQVDGKNAMLWFSFSDYRKEGANRSMAGWANRGLHNYDILYFKEHGYEIYDWGNIASFENPNQIDKFKMSFGGEIKTVYGCFIGNTLKGRILIKLRELKNKSKK